MSAVDVVMATFNGARFLREQLDSLYAQTDTRFRLIVADDGSSDDTAAILERERSRWGERLKILPASSHLGVVGNFNRALEASTAAHVMLCDQDDVWLPHKVETALSAVRAEERKRGADQPVLFHTDLVVVDDALGLVDSSMWRYQRLLPARGNDFPRMLLTNVAVGCTVMVNRPLLELALPLPAEAAMHDWWLALCACAFGSVIHSPTPSVLYRQHGANQAGAHRYGLIETLLRGAVERRGGMERVLDASQRQAGAFAERFRTKLEPNAYELAHQYSKLRRMGQVERRAFLLRSGIGYDAAARNLLLLARA